MSAELVLVVRRASHFAATKPGGSGDTGTVAGIAGGDHGIVVGQVPASAILLGGETERRHEVAAHGPESASVLQADDVVGEHRTPWRHRRDKNDGAAWSSGQGVHPDQGLADLLDKAGQFAAANLVMGDMGGDDPCRERQDTRPGVGLIAAAGEMVGEVRRAVGHRSGSAFQNTSCAKRILHSTQVRIFVDLRRSCQMLSSGETGCLDINQQPLVVYL